MNRVFVWSPPWDMPGSALWLLLGGETASLLGKLPDKSLEQTNSRREGGCRENRLDSGNLYKIYFYIAQIPDVQWGYWLKKVNELGCAGEKIIFFSWICRWVAPGLLTWDLDLFLAWRVLWPMWACAICLPFIVFPILSHFLLFIKHLAVMSEICK